MESGYWRVEFIQPAPGDDRCVMLRGQLDEVVGPLTMELAEAWIDQFDNRPDNRPVNRRAAGESAAEGMPSGAVPRPKLELPKPKPAS
jgi:hypothetical protein